MFSVCFGLVSVARGVTGADRLAAVPAAAGCRRRGDREHDRRSRRDRSICCCGRWRGSSVLLTSIIQAAAAFEQAADQRLPGGAVVSEAGPPLAGIDAHAPAIKPEARSRIGTHSRCSVAPG